ncbi:MAG: Wzz/FepE/Etk N-terminal domain-containing protein [Bacteroidetes bacterium]|nr:Wzz/FepE/Etk N-terminal domain-containing protein [Bacteroidota bacterium]
MSNKENNILTLSEIIDFIWRWKKPLIIISIITIVMAAIFSSPAFITPKFESTVVFYPATTNSISKSLLPERGERAQDALEFGAEEEAEKALQILQSSKLRDKLVSHFDLMKHYKIDPSKDKYPYTKLEKELDANIKVSRTRYLSIRIDVLDENPQMAANIATVMANLYDTIRSQINLERAVPALHIIEKAYQEKQTMIDGLHKQMQELGHQGVVNYEEQSKSIQEALIIAGGGALKGDSKMKTGQKVVDDLLDRQSKLVEFGGMYLSIVEKIKLEEEKLSDIKAKLDRAKVDVDETMTNQFRVSDATPAEKKSYPVRWLIVVISLMVALTGSTIVFAFVEKVRNNKKEKVHTQVS